MQSPEVTRRDVFRLATAGAAAFALGRRDAWASVSTEDARTLSQQADFYAGKPVIASDARGRAWVVTAIPAPDDAARVSVYAYDGAWSAPVAITPPGQYAEVAIACAAGGDPMAVWVAERSGRWTVEATVHQGDGFGESQTVGGSGKAAHPALAATEDGVFWLVWEAWGQGDFRIMAARYAGGAWSPPIAVTAEGERCYEPAVDVDEEGNAWVAYNRNEGGHRSIYLAAIEPQGLSVSEPVFISGGWAAERRAPRFAAHPTLACVSEGVWIAWESQRRHTTAAWFGEREIQARCYRNGALRQAAGQPAPHAGDNDQFPALLKDARGRVWALARRWRPDRKWELRASVLGESGWSAPVDLLPGRPQGRLCRPAVSPAAGGGLWVAWQSDTWTDESLPQTSSDMHAARVDLGEPVRGRARLETTAPEPRPSRPYVRETPPRATVTVEGETYTVLFGNFHEHSNFSRCLPDGSDGNIDLNYRFGMDVEKYDFMGLTDHGFDMTEAQWRDTRRKARFYNDPPHFVAMPAYEWTLSTDPSHVLTKVDPGSGHRNLVFRTDDDAAKWLTDDGLVLSKDTVETDRIDKVWKVLRAKDVRAVTIPHHPADKSHPVSWDFYDPEYETVVEIFQCRGSAEYPGCPGETQNLTPNEGCHVSDALARGHRMGFIASGDHRATGIGVAALLVKEVSQEGVFEALASRRCYAATGEKMLLDFRANGAIMGEVTEAEGSIRIVGEVKGTAPLTQIVVFRGRDEILRLTEAELEGGLEWRGEISDTPPAGMESYYYLRAMQAPKEIAWSSPVFVVA